MKKNKIIKKALTLGLVAALAIGITACGQSAKDTKAVSDKATTTAQKADKGSVKTLSGKYQIKGSKDQYYVFKDSKAYILKEGTYKLPSDEDVTLTYAASSETYKVKEGDDKGSYNLKHKSTLIPVTFKSGFDGLSGTDKFSGIYTIGGDKDWKYTFQKDGTFTEVNCMKAKVAKSSVTIAGSKYQWKTSANGKNILLQSNGHTIMTLIPSK